MVKCSDYPPSYDKQYKITSQGTQLSTMENKEIPAKTKDDECYEPATGSCDEIDDASGCDAGQEINRYNNKFIATTSHF